MFEGKVAVVTGGGSGIGKALAERLSASGARVREADLDLDAARSVGAGIGDAARAYRCDVADPEQPATLADRVTRDLGGVDLVFANAGVAVGGTVADTDPAEFRWLFDVNVGGTFHTIQAFLPALRRSAARQRAPRFVITGSENALGVPPGSPGSVYNATKHALLGLADCLRRDLSDTGIGVSLICPGLVSTNVWNARRHRQEGYGGAREMPPEIAERAAKAMEQHGMAPELTAALALEGVARDDFLIITDARIRGHAEPRMDEVRAALDRIDARLVEQGKK